jgi:hypothetical protein
MITVGNGALIHWILHNNKDMFLERHMDSSEREQVAVYTLRPNGIKEVSERLKKKLGDETIMLENYMFPHKESLDNKVLEAYIKKGLNKVRRPDKQVVDWVEKRITA